MRKFFEVDPTNLLIYAACEFFFIKETDNHNHRIIVFIFIK